MRHFIFLISLLSFVLKINGQLKIEVNDSIISYKKSIRIKEDDKIRIFSTEKIRWVQFKPELKEYDNLIEKNKKIQPVDYTVDIISDGNTLELGKLSAGTYYFGKIPENNPSFQTIFPIQREFENIVQIIVREDNTYLGLLTELLNLPFIIPPKYIRSYGHQTDLSIGTDCAELAIYGMRRLGYRIPYCGPKKIYKYLSEVNYVTKGNILHFGFQVSILYEDKGIIGKIDEEDLLIHAYQDCVKIERIGDTKLIRLPFKTYKWKMNN